MLDRIITHRELLELVNELALTRRLIGPVAREGRFFYEPAERAERFDLSFNYCVYGPRAFLFPPTETLLVYNSTDHSFTARPVQDDADRAFIGVHPCDVNAIRMLDRVFSRDHPDPNYLSRRARTFIVGIDCPRPCAEGVFCADMLSNTANEGFDAMLYPLRRSNEEEGVFGVVFGTEAGREWVRYSRKGTPPSLDDRKEMERYLVAKQEAFPRSLKTPFEKLPDLLDRSYDSLIWEATARRCYSCGSCNLSCPTCYCFNIFDENDLDGMGGRRKRTWDGCQLDSFAVVAGGHNFRSKASSRLRHRIYRKAKWIFEQSGVPGCVGCARCDRACTAKINTVTILNQLSEGVGP